MWTLCTWALSPLAWKEEDCAGSSHRVLTWALHGCTRLHLEYLFCSAAPRGITATSPWVSGAEHVWIILKIHSVEKHCWCNFGDRGWAWYGRILAILCLLRLAKQVVTMLPSASYNCANHALVSSPVASNWTD